MLALVAVVALSLTSQVSVPSAPAAVPTQVASGEEITVTGVITKREADTFSVLDKNGQEVKVTLTSETQVKEKKKNPFRSGKNYATTNLLRGLNVEVKGRKDASGNLFAEQVKFADIDYRMANSVESRVTPVEGRLKDTEGRLSQAEQNQQRLSGQVEELSAISNSARGGAKAAQETADAAIAGVNAANERMTKIDTKVGSVSTRISALDDFNVQTSQMINFGLGSAVLSKESKETLDKLAEEAKTQKGYVIEIAGFASADGPEDVNRRLSQMRADAVVRYLAEKHSVPLRRIITPFGYGESQPVADNKTRDGRKQNRRVEVKILVNKGLLESGQSAAPTGQ